MLFAVLATMLAADEGPPTEVVERERPRLHWEASFRGLLPFGLGVTGELGVVLGDRHVLSLRGAATTHLVVGSYEGGLHFAEWLGERFTLGLGATVKYVEPWTLQPAAFLGGYLPVRATFLVMSRPEGQRERRGLTFGLEFSPGFGKRLGTAAPLGFSYSGALTIGWASW